MSGRSRVSATLIVAIGYFVTGKLGLLLSIPPGYAAPFWPAAGIALGVVLIVGKHVRPGILLG